MQHCSTHSSPIAKQLWLVRDALRYLNDSTPLRLGHTRCARTLLAHEPDALQRGRRLQRCLLAAIAAIRPITALADDERRSWAYHIFVLECVQGVPRAEAARRLAVSRATYVRAKRQGLDQIVTLLPHLLDAHEAAPTRIADTTVPGLHLTPSDVIAATLCGCVIEGIDEGVRGHLTFQLAEPRMGLLQLRCGGATLLSSSPLDQHFTRLVPWERTIQWADWPTPNTLQLFLANATEITLRLSDVEIVPFSRGMHERAA